MCGTTVFIWAWKRLFEGALHVYKRSLLKVAKQCLTVLLISLALIGMTGCLFVTSSMFLSFDDIAQCALPIPIVALQGSSFYSMLGYHSEMRQIVKAYLKQASYNTTVGTCLLPCTTNQGAPQSKPVNHHGAAAR